MDLAYRAVDADNHYYETLDACTRHLDREYRRRGVQAVQEGTHTLLLAGGKLFRFIPNPTFDPIIVAGVHGPHVPRPGARRCRPADADEGRAPAARVPRTATRGSR